MTVAVSRNAETAEILFGAVFWQMVVFSGFLETMMHPDIHLNEYLHNPPSSRFTRESGFFDSL